MDLRGSVDLTCSMMGQMMTMQSSELPYWRDWSAKVYGVPMSRIPTVQAGMGAEQGLRWIGVLFHREGDERRKWMLLAQE